MPSPACVTDSEEEEEEVEVEEEEEEEEESQQQQQYATRASGRHHRRPSEKKVSVYKKKYSTKKNRPKQRQLSTKQHIRILSHTSDRVYVLMYRTHWTMEELRLELMKNPRTLGNVVPRDGEFHFSFNGRRQQQHQHQRLVLPLCKESKWLARDLNSRQLQIILNHPETAIFDYYDNSNNNNNNASLAGAAAVGNNNIGAAGRAPRRPNVVG